MITGVFVKLQKIRFVDIFSHVLCKNSCHIYVKCEQHTNKIENLKNI